MNASLPAKTRPRDFWQTLDTFLMCILIVAMCSQINLRAIGRDTLATEGYVTKQLFLALSDVVFLGVFAWFCARTTMLRAWRKLWIPPLPCFALIFIMLISALHSPHVVDATRETLASSHGVVGTLKALKDTKEFKESAAEILQFAATFLLAPLLFVNLLRDRRVHLASTREYSQGGLVDRTRVATIIFAVSAFVQIVYTSKVRHDEPHGLWSSPNIYGVFVTVAFTFLSILALDSQKRWLLTQKKTSPKNTNGGMKLPPLFASDAPTNAGSLSKTSTLFAFAAIVIMADLNTVSSAWPFAAILFGALAGIIAIRAGKLGLVLMFILLVMMPLSWSSGVAKLQQARLESWRVATPTQKVKKQYVEWYAALGWSRPAQKQFATGVGAGNYQFNIGSYYGGLPNEEKMPPDSNNLYLVQAASLGALGLASLLWVLAHFAKIAWRAARKHAASTRSDASNANALGAATFAALVAFAFVNVFHAGLVRGMSFVLAFLFSLAVVAAMKAHDEIPKSEGENDVS